MLILHYIKDDAWIQQENIDEQYERALLLNLDTYETDIHTCKDLVDLGVYGLHCNYENGKISNWVPYCTTKVLEAYAESQYNRTYDINFRMNIIEESIGIIDLYSLNVLFKHWVNLEIDLCDSLDDEYYGELQLTITDTTDLKNKLNKLNKKMYLECLKLNIIRSYNTDTTDLANMLFKCFDISILWIQEDYVEGNDLGLMLKQTHEFYKGMSTKHKNVMFYINATKVESHAIKTYLYNNKLRIGLVNE